MVQSSVIRREIRLRDVHLLTFETSTSELGELSGRTVWVNHDDLNLMPAALMIDQTWPSVWDWLEARRIPRNRAFVEKILQQAGLAESDTLGIIDACKGLSLNDSYWVVPEGFEGTWAEYNLYTHPLDDVLSLVAYTGVTTSQRHAAGASSEWTTSGSYPKAWRTIEGRPVLFKAGNWELYDGAANQDLGPFSEYFAAEVAEVLGVPHVSYGLENWKGHLASTCACFCNENVSFVPLWDACGVSGFLGMAAALLARSEDELSHFLDLVTFDALIANPDRHANNLGFLRDVSTGEFMGLAPLFDQNKALFPTDLPSDYPAWPYRARDMMPAGTNLSFGKIMERFQTQHQHELLRRLVDFRLSQHPSIRLPQDRIDALNNLISTNARYYLRYPVHSMNEVVATIRSTEAWRRQDTSRMPLFVRL